MGGSRPSYVFIPFFYLKEYGILFSRMRFNYSLLADHFNNKLGNFLLTLFRMGFFRAA